MATNLEQLKERLAEVYDLTAAQELLGWDHHTYMPPAAGPARAEQMATLQKLAHRLFTARETQAWLAGAEQETASLPQEELDRALVIVARRDMDEALKLPEDLVTERARTGALAMDAWAHARAESDYSRFAPWLEKNIALEQRVAECKGYKDTPYDALLDAYEPGARTVDVKALFAELRERLVPLAHRIAERGEQRDPFLSRSYPLPDQELACKKLTEGIGYDYQRGRLDSTIHPFASSFSRLDARITTRYDQDDPCKAIFAALHEAGHAMYEQGMPEEYERTGLRGGASLGVHESQSRLWENLVGRSERFWTRRLDLLREHFPEQLSDVDEGRFYRAINHVCPTLIRVEADEVTYNLHVLVRFEMETDLIEGKLPVKDAPEAWNARMQAHLGITPPDDRLGVLQDVHWSMGAIGYFPTYTLGTLLACQLWDTAISADPSIPQAIQAGDCSGLLGWLRENVHRYGRRYLPADLVIRATGKPLTAAPFLRYLEQKYGKLYALDH